MLIKKNRRRWLATFLVGVILAVGGVWQYLELVELERSNAVYTAHKYIQWLHGKWGPLGAIYVLGGAALLCFLVALLQALGRRVARARYALEGERLREQRASASAAAVSAARPAAPRRFDAPPAMPGSFGRRGSG